MHLPIPRTGDSLTIAPVYGAHAVVLGASMSGLLAARILSDHFDQVTVVERDRLPVDARCRRGVPQGRHAHVLLPRGAQVLDHLFPDLLWDLAVSGVPVAEALDQSHFEFNGHVFYHGSGSEGPRRDDAGLSYQPSRPFLESRILQRVKALPNVDFLDACDVDELTANSLQTLVTGARVSPREVDSPSRELAADLVVAATGRSGRAPAWLKSLGYAPPAEEEVHVDLKYVTQRVRFPEGSVEGRRAVLVGGTPDRPTGVGAFAQEENSWIVTMAGYAGHHPPMEREAWLSFGEQFLPRDFAKALRHAEPLDELHQHRFSTNLRRRYDKMVRFPEGLLVIGDAQCSFNPVYGQGMTVAALEALALQHTLRGGWSELAPRYFEAAAEPIERAWRFAVGADLTMPRSVVPGPRSLPTRAVNSYVDRFQAAAEHDPVMAWRFLDVTGFEEPPSSLFSGDSLRRVASNSRHRRRTGSSRMSLAAAALSEGMRWP